MIPPEDRFIGLGKYVIKGPIINHKIKFHASTFRVVEVINSKLTQEIKGKGKCLLAVYKPWGLEFRGMLKIISEKLKVRSSKIDYLGIKDANSTSVSYILIPRPFCEGIFRRGEIIKINDISMSPLSEINLYHHKRRLHIGNLFNIDILILDHFSKALVLLRKVSRDINTDLKIPNYYGYQRFGFRRIYHILGLKILKKDYEGFFNTLYFEKFPWFDKPYYKYLEERTEDFKNLSHVNKVTNVDAKLYIAYQKGIVRDSELVSFLPRWYKRFLINSLQSYIFNKVLSRRIELGYPINKCVSGDYCLINGAIRMSREFEDGVPLIPLIGYSYRPHVDSYLDDMISGVLKELDLDKSLFYQPDTGIKVFGGFREAVISFIHPFKYYRSIYDPNRSIKLIFGIKRGCYATIVLRELFKPRNPCEQGY